MLKHNQTISTPCIYVNKSSLFLTTGTRYLIWVDTKLLVAGQVVLAMDLRNLRRWLRRQKQCIAGGIRMTSDQAAFLDLSLNATNLLS